MRFRCIEATCVMNLCRDNEFTINAFLAPQMLLMTVPIVGPIVFVPVQAASAWLVDLLSRKSAVQRPVQADTVRGAMSSLAAAFRNLTQRPQRSNTGHPSSSAAGNMAYAAPTMPASPPIFEQQGYPQHRGTPSAYYQQQ